MPKDLFDPEHPAQAPGPDTPTLDGTAAGAVAGTKPADPHATLAIDEPDPGATLAVAPGGPASGTVASGSGAGASADDFRLATGATVDLPGTRPDAGAEARTVAATGGFRMATDQGAATIDVAGARTEAATGEFRLPTAAEGDATLDLTATGDFDTGGEIDRGRALRPTQVAPPGPRSAAGAIAGAQCGRYVLKKFHARGGMGEIWLAEDPAIGRSVALKRMLGRQPEQVRRFEVEAAVTGRLEHPGIVPVHELGVNDEGQPFYVMKFVQGRTLQKVIEEYHAGEADRPGRELELCRLLQMFVSLCQTVAYAHSRGVLHRDLKPENVMLGAYGETLLLDWGIAKVMVRPGPDDAPGEGGVGGPGATLGAPDDGTDTGTRYGAIMGTPMYMAPEVAMGLTDEIDHRSDVYLLGGTLYAILTGRHPRDGKTAMEMVKLARTEAPPPARQLKPEAPRALEAICKKAMATRREDRYQYAPELAEDVQRYLAGEAVSAYPEGLAARAWRWAKRHRRALLRSAAALAFVAVVLLSVAAIREAERGRVAAVAEANRLKALDQARRDVAGFRRLADEARYYAATTDPVSENAPYFDPGKGLATASKARAIASKWGPALAGLPLRDQVEPIRRDLYELALLETGGARAPTASADRPPPATTASDAFALGEHYRRQAGLRPVEKADWTPWLPDEPLMEKAIARYRSALQLDPDHYWSHLQIGRCLMRLGRLDEAIEALGTCVALRPDAPWGYQARALALGQKRRFAEAEQDLDRAGKLDPDSRIPVLHRALLAYEQGNDSEAMTGLDAALAPPKEKRLPEAALYRGQLHAKLGEVDRALEDFSASIAELPGLRRAFLHRARIYAARGEDALALADLDHYFEGSVADEGEAGDDWRRHARRGWLLKFLYTELPQDRRRQPSGLALAKLGRAEFLKAIQLGGRSAELFDDTGAILERNGLVDEAILAYTEGLKLAPDEVRMRVKRAWAYEAKGRRDAAFEDFAAAAKASPEDAEAHTGLGYLLALRKDRAEAQREADLALLHGSDRYLVLHNVACIYSVLSESAGSAGQAAEFQGAAVAILRRAVSLWRRAASGPDELDLIGAEPAFRALRGRDDFRQLLGQGADKAARPTPAGPPQGGPA